MRNVFLLGLFLLSGCGLRIEEINQEILPRIEQNKDQIELLKSQNQKQLATFREEISNIELSISTLRDRLQALHTEVVRDLNAQNEHLELVDKFQLEMLQKSRLYMQSHLESTLKLIEQLEAKLQLSSRRGPKPLKFAPKLKRNIPTSSEK